MEGEERAGERCREVAWARRWREVAGERETKSGGRERGGRGSGSDTQSVGRESASTRRRLSDMRRERGTKASESEERARGETQCAGKGTRWCVLG